jgi:hypothetical protein
VWKEELPAIDLAYLRDQQRRAAEELQKPEPEPWARLALFDAFTEELFLVGAFERVKGEK